MSVIDGVEISLNCVDVTFDGVAISGYVVEVAIKNVVVSQDTVS